MSRQDNGDRPATRDDVIYAVMVLIMVMMLCSASDSCGRRLQINKLHEDLRRELKPQ